MRILVTGNAGSGKSTFARRLGTALDLPVFGLDRVVWQPGWRKTPAGERAAMIAELCAGPEWVIDGVSHEILAAADIVVFLDVPRLVSIGRCARRTWRYLFRSRPGLPENCPEISIIPQLLKIIWRFPTAVRPQILAAMGKRNGGAFIVRNNRELEDVFRHLIALKGQTSAS